MKNQTMDFDRLYTACNRNEWFTCGSNEQYEKMFDMNNHGASIRDLAVIIWACSEGYELEEIEEKLKELEEEYLLALGDAMQARGERNADEVFSGYYD